MKRLPIAGCAALALSACTVIPPGDGASPGTPGDTCEAAPGQRFIGQRASAEVGNAIVAATRSERVRWVPPRTAITMEYAFGRVTVSYDDDYLITQVTCG